jgi:hypothetical protein
MGITLCNENYELYLSYSMVVFCSRTEISYTLKLCMNSEIAKARYINRLENIGFAAR